MYVLVDCSVLLRRVRSVSVGGVGEGVLCWVWVGWAREVCAGCGWGGRGRFVLGVGVGGRGSFMLGVVAA